MEYKAKIWDSVSKLRSVPMGSKLLAHIGKSYEEIAQRSFERLGLGEKYSHMSKPKRVGKFVYGRLFGPSGERDKLKEKTKKLVAIENEAICALSDLYETESKDKIFNNFDKAGLEIQVFNRLLVIYWEFLKVEIDTIIGEACELAFENMSLKKEHEYARALSVMSEVFLSMEPINRPPCNLFEYIIEKGLTRGFKHEVKEARQNLGLFDIDDPQCSSHKSHRKSDWRNLVNPDADFKYCYRLYAPSRDPENSWNNYSGCNFGMAGGVFDVVAYGCDGGDGGGDGGGGDGGGGGGD